jgi:hypothetical protein
MPPRMWHVYCLRTKDSSRPIEEIGTYDHLDIENPKASDIIKLDAESYRVVFLVHAGRIRSGGKLIVVPADRQG